ncbi:MAG: hypothetical protein JSW07_11100 [bacterium]|nr:MAG: hypothetical protein JSW07_11100 [bacterium]
MKLVSKIISYAGLVLTLIPSFLVLTNGIEFNTHKHLMLLGTVLWFGTRPFWMSKSTQEK